MLVLVAYAGSVICEWALWVAVLVYAYQHGGSTTAGIAAVLLLVPTVFVAPWAGRAADGPRPNRVLATVYSVQSIALAVATVLAFFGLHAVFVVGAAAVSINAITFIRPTISVVVPSIVVAPADLVAANLLTGNADSWSVLAGPLMASGLLALGSSTLVFGGCALVGLACSCLVWPTARKERALPQLPERSRRTGIRDLAALVRSMSRTPGSTQLLTVLAGQYVLVGGLDLLYVNIAFRVLHLADSGPGLLNASFGVGAVIGGMLSALVIARRRLAPALIAAVLVIAAAMLVLGGWTTFAGTVTMLGVAGAGRSMLDVTGRMLLQRSAPQDALASVFAVLEVLAGAGTLCGSLLVQVLVAISGVQAAVIGVAGAFLLVAVCTAPALRHADEHADAPVVEIRLLRSVPLFAPLPGPELEVLARTAVPVAFDEGDAVVREGEVGDRYYVIADGTVEVSVDGRSTRTMSRGEGFGEIALLAAVARTATVVARTRCAMLAVERANFLRAVVGHDASARVAWAVARSLHPPIADGDG